VRTLAGIREAGFAHGLGAAARFLFPRGLAQDKDRSIMVVTRALLGQQRGAAGDDGWSVSKVEGNGEAGYSGCRRLWGYIYYKAISRLIQGCYKANTRLLQG
jgi:hypothetical protein